MTDRPSAPLTLAEIETAARDLGRVIGAGLPAGVGFTLLLFDFGEGGNLTYISNAARDDMLRVMQEFMQKAGH